MRGPWEGWRVPASEAQQRHVAARRERLIEARARGMTFEQIVTAKGFEDYRGRTSHAVQDYQRALSSRHQQLRVLAEYQLTEELGRLAGLERRAQAILAQCVEANDRAGGLRAIGELRKLSERRSLMLGLDQVSAQAAGDSGGRAESVTDELSRKRARRRSARRTAGM